MCAYHCVQLSYTTQHRTVLIIFPIILHTIVIAQMMSTGTWSRGIQILDILQIICRDVNVFPVKPRLNRGNSQNRCIARYTWTVKTGCVGLSLCTSNTVHGVIGNIRERKIHIRRTLWVVITSVKQACVSASVFFCISAFICARLLTNVIID